MTPPRLLLRPLRAAAAALLASTALAAAPAHATAAPTEMRTVLRCRIATATERPVTFSPELTRQPRTIRVTGTFRVTHCTSPDGSEPRLRGGMAMIQGNALASCGGASGITGSGRIVWYDTAGRRAGVSTLQPLRDTVKGHNPADAFLGGKVTRGPLTGAYVSGSATPTSDVSQCAGAGLRTVRGTGRVRFLR
ncbi:hypothetical protein [Streptomyces sp. UNOB3_S3]|uniref:hypothetical protein n=1 Tax=Streptomyces sp. UNOB3_S3 TaxID=2871682 RepID=UPI001E5265F5|nr:hypothetical protein [Streptomyces sp. UNOB3_S3]MCC3777706.1 hypothetical protein [Streptomyces sp. UNOB3_S3]